MGITRLVCTLVMIATLACPVWAQPVLTGPAQTFPSSPLSMPAAFGGSSGQSVSINNGALSEYIPTIPNLELGFQYFFGDRVRSGQANADYLLPYNLSPNSVIFGEAHGNWWNFINKPPGGASSRIDLSFGGGYRHMLSDQLLLGVNGFYDSSRLFDQWYSSGSVGLELAANIGTSDAVDLNANWYGDIFSSTDIINAFRNHGGSYDIEAGYSHALFNNSLDLRLKFAGYQFDTGSNVYGYKTGADLTTKDGMFMLRYEYGNDRINGQWNNIGAFVNVGFQMENIIRGESPFTAPEPVFKSPRNLKRMLTQKVKRDWNQQYAPGRAALAAAAVSGGRVVCFSPNRTTVNFATGTTVVTLSGMDYTQFARNAYVTMTFDYENTGEEHVFWDISVYNVFDPEQLVMASVTIPANSSDSVTLVLDSNTQSVFTTLNPNQIYFGAGNWPGITFSNIRVCFTYR